MHFEMRAPVRRWGRALWGQCEGVKGLDGKGEDLHKAAEGEELAGYPFDRNMRSWAIVPKKELIFFRETDLRRERKWGDGPL